MGKEIERKFLVKGEFKHLAVKSYDILQTYLFIDNEKSMRLRITGEKACITIKSRPRGNSISRGEWEFPVPVSDARELVNLCLPGKIEKTRYLVPAGRHTYEIDVFHDKNEGLVIAEIELKSETEQFTKPEWLGEEVTGLPEYYNANLIK